MLVVFKGKYYLVDRKNEVKQVNNFEKFYNDGEFNYIIDGELVRDEGNSWETFLIFDALVIHNKNIMHWDFLDRLSTTREAVIKPLWI